MRFSPLLFALSLAACSTTGADDGRPVVAVTVAPLADLVRGVAGERARVEQVVPPGIEPHDAALGPSQIRALRDADVVVMIGGGFQPAVEEAVAAHPSVIDAAARTDGPAGDPHVWLDPEHMVRVVQQVRDAIAASDPEGRAAYARGTSEVLAMLTEVDTAYREGLARCRSRLLITSHEAFGHLAARYRLEQHGVTGLEPGAPSDPARLRALSALIRREGITTLFGESDAIETLARETGAAVGALQPLEVLDEGDRYAWAMERNLEVLRTGLGCRG